MARRASLIARKPKKVRVTRSEAYLVNYKYMGDEPVLKDGFTQSEYGNALNWYNCMSNTAEAREYLETWLQSQNRNADIKKLKQVSDTWVPTTGAWIARMLTRGYNLTDYSKKFLEDSLIRAFSKTVTAPSEKKLAPTVSIQQRMKDKADEILGEVEGIVDDRANTPNFSLYDWLRKKEIPAVYASQIGDMYVGWLAELLEALEGTDEQLNEAYAKVPKKKMDYDIKFLNMLIEDSERYADTTKKTRKPRKPRTISVEKKLKNLKYQKEDSNFKIASVSPEKLIGCQELWTFNTKYKTLTVLRAIDRGGLQIKGTSIINYDEKNSFTKRTGRKPEFYVDKVLNGGKIVLRKLMEEMKSDAALAYRINENTILMKVIN